MRRSHASLLCLVGVSSALCLSGCGGGGGGGSSSSSSTASVSGTLINSTTQQPLSGVTVEVQGASNSTTSASNGTFTLTGVSDGSVTLVFTSGGSTIATDGITVSGSTDNLGNLNITTQGNPPGVPPLLLKAVQ